MAGTGGVPNLETRTYHDSTIRIFGSDGTVTHKLKDHTQPIMGLATYGDGFVSVSNDGCVKGPIRPPHECAVVFFSHRQSTLTRDQAVETAPSKYAARMVPL